MIQVKRAKESDAEILSQLSRKTFVETYAADNTPENLELYLAENFSVQKQGNEIRDPCRWIAIAWSGSTAVGFIHLIRSTPDPLVVGDKPVEVLRIYIDLPWQGRGVGAALMDEGFKMARKEGFKTVWLGVWERNLKAQAFYMKYGFTPLGTHIFKFGTEDQTDLILIRAI